MMRPLLLVLGCAAALAACAVGPDYSLPKEALVQAPAANGSFTARDNATLSQDAPPDRWWRLYQDPALDGIVARALAANTDLRASEATLERSHALVEEARAARQPSLAVGGFASYGELSGESYLLEKVIPPSKMYDIGLSASFDLDLFGRLRRAVEAAGADDESVAAVRDLVRLEVVAQTTRAYADVCNAGAELAVARRALELQQKSLALTQRLVAAGRGASLDETRSRGQVAQLSASIPRIEAARRNAALRLAMLTGRTPAEIDPAWETCATPPRITAALPVGNGGQMLRRRPDVHAAERRLAAATARIGVATAGLYPDINLGASIGSTGAMDDFLTKPTNRYNIGPGISWQLNQSAARARIAGAEADVKADLARFDGVVLGALRECETALNVYVYDLKREQDLQQACDMADRAVQDAHRLQQYGRVAALAVLDAERTQASAAMALARQKSQVSLDQINVFEALGGGWQADNSASAAPREMAAGKN